MSSSLSTGSALGAFTVVSASATTVDLSSSEGSEEEKKMNIGLIVGLAVGIPALVSKNYVIQLSES